MPDYKFDYSEYEDAIKKIKSACAKYESVIDNYTIIMRTAILVGIKEGESAEALKEYVNYVDILKNRLDILCGQTRKYLKEMDEQIESEDRYR